MTLQDSFVRIFEYESENINEVDKLTYSLAGMVLYSAALSHYINVKFNMEKNLFVLYNDDKIKELSSIHEVYREITAEQMKNNPNSFYYPVLLIYFNEIIYIDRRTREINDYYYSNFKYLEDLCIKAEKMHVELTKEQKRINHLELIEAQMEYNRRMSEGQRDKRFGMIIEDDIKHSSSKFINIHNNFSLNKKNDENMIIEEEGGKIFEFEGDEEKEDEKKYEKKRINKKYGTDYKKNYKYVYPDNNAFPNII